VGAASPPQPVRIASPRPIVRAASPLAPARAASALPPARPASPQPDFIECTDRRFFEILETYQNRARPLHDHVTWDAEEEERLKQRRIEAYQLRAGTDYKPHDVFHLWPYTRVDPEHVIRRVQLKKDAPKALPEFSHILHVHVVSDRVMKAITALEEGRHAFYPLDIMVAEGGTSYPYHFMQFLEHTDCTVPEKGGFRRGVRQDGTSYWVRNSTDEKVSLDAERVGTRHLFHDKRAKSGCFISGELAAKLGDFLPRGYYLAEAGLVRKRA
jgi:hypothetical protein